MDEILFIDIAKACQFQLNLPSIELAESLSDAVWLSKRLAIAGIDWAENDIDAEPPSVLEGDEELPTDNVKVDLDEQPNHNNTELDSRSGSESLSSGIRDAYADHKSSIANIPGRRVMFPSVPPLQGAREFERAWRPFAKRVPDWQGTQLDERATADQIASTLGTVWSIATKPKMDRRWKGVAIFERSPTMRFWQNTLDAFYKTMWRTSAFNRLQLAYVDGFKESPVLCKNQALTHTIELQSIANETEDERVFLFTDFRSNSWLNGSMLELVQSWHSTTNVVIVHMMSEMHWLHSALRHFELTEEPDSHPQLHANKGRIPIFSFAPQSLGNWVNWSTGVSGSKVTMMFLNPRLPFQKVIPVAREQRSQEAIKERADLLYKRFVQFGSEPAQMLARSLASAPLLLPVIRLIQRCELPESTSSHLSEILYSGLIERHSKADNSTDPDTIEYDFLPGVRDNLLSNSSRQRIDRVLHLNWEYMQSRFGNGINFNAIIANPSQAEHLTACAIDNEVAPFARVGGQILQRLGGKQAEAGSTLLARLSQPKPKIINATKIESERLKLEYETLKVKFENGTNLPIGTKFRHPNLRRSDTYRPISAKSSRLWRPTLRRAGLEFLDLLERGLVVSCSLHQSINPFPARPESRDLWRWADATVEGLGIESEKLVNAKGEELESEYAFVNAQGIRICNAAGNPQAYMLGMNRIFYLSAQGSPSSPAPANSVKAFRELAERASEALAMMARFEAKKLWRNWKHGFSASCFGKEHLWYDALFELGFQKEAMFAFDRFLILNHEDQSCDRLSLIGDGVFPRLPATLPKEIVDRIPHQLGYPIDSECLIADVVAASVTAINHMLGIELQELRRKKFLITAETGHFATVGAEAQLEVESTSIDFRSIEFEDGTNVRKGSSFTESVRRFSRGAWYLPSEQVSAQNWKYDWQDILTRLHELRSKKVTLSCTLLQSNVPRVGDLAFSSKQNTEHKQSIRGFTGLGREFVQLQQTGKEPLLAEYPFVDVNRNPIATSAGEAFPCRLGFSRQYFVFEETDLERGEAFNVSQKVFEAFKSASLKLRDLPKHIAEKIWNRWSDGFDSSKFGEDSLWHDALFELAFNRYLSRPFQVDRFVGISTEFDTTGRVKLAGDGLYPRIPIEVSQKAYESIPNQLGYSDYFEALIPDLVTTSVEAIRWILSNKPSMKPHKSVLLLHGEDSEEHIQRCSALSKRFRTVGYKTFLATDIRQDMRKTQALDAAENADRILVILSQQLFLHNDALKSASKTGELAKEVSVLDAILSSENRKKVWVVLLSETAIDWRLDKLMEFPHIILDELNQNSTVLEGIVEWDSTKISDGMMLVGQQAGQRKKESTGPTFRHRVFISFSYSEDNYRLELRTLLKADNAIEDHFFDDMEVKPGSDWDRELRIAASETRVMIMLVSPMYLDRGNCRAWKYEIPSALEAHARKEVTILWVAARQAQISDTPFAAIQACHSPSRPLDSLSENERIEVYQRIRDEVKRIISSTDKSPEAMLTSAVPSPKVFISYSQELAEHKQRILDFANHLRKDGIDATIDQYEPDPPEGWPIWTKRQSELSDFVLIICSQKYYQQSLEKRSRNYRGSVLPRSSIFQSPNFITKFIPIVLGVEDREWVLPTMQAYTISVDQFDLEQPGGYQDLYRLLTKQPKPTPRGTVQLHRLPSVEKLKSQTDTPTQFPTTLPSVVVADGGELDNLGTDGITAPEAELDFLEHDRQGREMSDAQIDFLVICPLAEERDAVLNLLPGHRRIKPVLNDTNTYFEAQVGIAEGEGRYGLVVLPLTGMGLANAASATSNAIQRWKPRYILVTGIAGGVAKNGVDLGDVLISDQIADYELQKIEAGKGSIRWQVHRADVRLLSAAMNHLDKDWQSVDSKRFDSNSPKVHFGPICTGNKVIADDSLIDQYRDVWVKMIGVEMEGGGVANAVWQSATQPGMLMIRGVSDLADGKKGSTNTKRWRPYACEIAASWTINFLKSGPVPMIAAKPSANQSSLPKSNDINEPDSSEQKTAIPKGLLECLSGLPSSMFNEIVFSLETENDLKQGHVPGSEAAQTTRAIRLLEVVQVQQLLPKLLEILAEVKVWRKDEANTPIEARSLDVNVDPKPNFPDRKTKVLIVGSYSARQPKSEQKAFEKACQELGKELVRAGYTIVGSSSKPTTADYHVFAGANQSRIRGKVILIRPTASVESDDFEKSVLSNLDVERQYIRGIHSDARQSQIDEANLIIAIGGATGTKQVMDVAEDSRKAVIPIGAFGGAVLENWDVQADRLFDETDLEKRFGVLRDHFDPSMIIQLLEELGNLPMPLRHFRAKSGTANPLVKPAMQPLAENRFRVALSFPGEEREFVEALADYLATKLSKREVFYDEWYEVELLGAGGDLKLVAMYEQADLVVPFFSEHYDKPWCQLEWETIRGILLSRRKDDAVIPVHMDDTAIPGWAVVNFGIRRKSRSPEVIGQIILNALDLRARRSQSGIKQSTPISNADLNKIPPQQELAEELFDYLAGERDVAGNKSSRTEIDRRLAELKAYIPKIMNPPTELEQRRFLRQSFATICDFFTQAGNLFEKSNSRVNIEFSRPDTEKFRCEIYLDGKQITGCRIWIGSGKFDFGIHYFQGRDVSNEFNARNETLVVDTSSTGESLQLKGILGISHSESIVRADAQTASQVLWKRFVRQLES